MQTRVLNAISLDFLNWYWQINFAQLLLMFFYFLTLRLMNMTTQRHGNIDKEWSMTKNVMSEKMEDILFSN